VVNIPTPRSRLDSHNKQKTFLGSRVSAVLLRVPRQRGVCSVDKGARREEGGGREERDQRTGGHRDA
jgi:hypothetical protein